jgi:hypothetical protein
MQAIYSDSCPTSKPLLHLETDLVSTSTAYRSSLRELQDRCTCLISVIPHCDPHALGRLQTSVDDLKVVLGLLLAVRSRDRELGRPDVYLGVSNLIHQF